MSDELKKFLRFLFEADTGYVYSPCKKLTGEWNQRFFLWPSESEKVHDWITSSTHEGNVYLSPALFKEKAATKESFKTTNVAWVEFDGSTNIDFKEINQPDVIVQTSSPTHVHCYWKIKPANVESVENINRRLTYYLGADNSGWDCTQVLRPPGTLNHKYSKPIETLLVKFQPSFIKRDLSRFDKAPEIEKPPLIITYDSLLDPEKVIVENKLGIDLIKMIKSEFVKQGNHSTYLMRLGYLLGSSGLNEIEIISLLYLADSRIKKFVGRSDQLLRLSEIAAIASLCAISIEN